MTWKYILPLLSNRTITPFQKMSKYNASQWQGKKGCRGVVLTTSNLEQSLNAYQVEIDLEQALDWNCDKAHRGKNRTQSASDRAGGAGLVRPDFELQQVNRTHTR
jgi:hypothetical protein